jgi:hypothetical protein
VVVNDNIYLILIFINLNMHIINKENLLLRIEIAASPTGPLFIFIIDHKIDSKGYLKLYLMKKNGRKANSLERDILEVTVSLFDEYQNGVIPFNEIWLHLIDETNGHINQYKEHELETKIY